jgi:hypothetical protein
MTNTNSPGVERPNYLQGQLLTAQDFADEQTYFREKLRRHNRLLHGWGVICGLEVTPAAEGCRVTVSPGYALDPCGDEILLQEETSLALPDRGREEGDQIKQAEGGTTACPDGVWYVAIRYAEIPSRLVPRIGDEHAPQVSRIRETCELAALATLPEPPTGLAVGGAGGISKSSGVCPPCPPDPEQRWVALADVRVQGGRIRVRNTKPIPRGYMTPTWKTRER